MTVCQGAVGKEDIKEKMWRDGGKGVLSHGRNMPVNKFQRWIQTLPIKHQN